MKKLLLLLLLLLIIITSCSIQSNELDIDTKGRVYVLEDGTVFDCNYGTYDIDTEYSNLQGFLIHVKGTVSGDGKHCKYLYISDVYIVQ